MSLSQLPPPPLAAVLEAISGMPRSLLVSRAAAGLVAVLRAWRAGGGGDRIALGAAVCHEVVVAITAAGCTPVFCDVCLEDGQVPEREWLRARASGVDVALVANLYGNPAPVAAVRSAFPAPRCLLIDDAAQALGSRSAEGPAGGRGDVGLLSFGATKHVTSGNAAVLLRDPEFAAQVAAVLAAMSPVDAAVRAGAAAAFRTRLDAAREVLRQGGGPFAFAGLLEPLEPVLLPPLEAFRLAPLLEALRSYPAAAALRAEKGRRWAAALVGSGFVPVGMAAACVPWRYACRLPGIPWSVQHSIAERLRQAGLHVSTWYLPAHWFQNPGAGTLPGVEGLASQVFQFWVNDEVTLESITQQGAGVVATLRQAVAQ